MLALYIKILKQAYELVRGHRVFWLAGLFLVWPNLFKSTIILVMGAALFGVMLMSQDAAQTGSGSELLFILFVVASIFIIWLYYKSKNFVMLAVHKLQNKSKLDLAELNKLSNKQTWLLARFSYSTIAVASLVVVIYLSPIFYLLNSGYQARAMVLVVLGLLAFVPIAFLIYIANILAPMFMVVYKIPLRNSLILSLDVGYRRWRFLLGFACTLWLINLVLLCLGVGLVLISNGPFVFLSQIFYDVGGIGSLMALRGLAGIAVFMLFFMLQAVVAVYSLVAWVMLFIEIVRPVKFEESQAVTGEPETAQQ